MQEFKHFETSAHPAKFYVIRSFVLYSFLDQTKDAAVVRLPSESDQHLISISFGPLRYELIIKHTVLCGAGIDLCLSYPSRNSVSGLYDARS
jgi:hypothetical protein